MNVKDVVAGRIADLLDHESWASAEMPENVREVSVTHPSKLVSQIRVATANQGVRYFTVRVSEAI